MTVIKKSKSNIIIKLEKVNEQMCEIDIENQIGIKRRKIRQTG